MRARSSPNGDGAHSANGHEPAGPPGDPPIDLGRVGAAVRRHAALVVAIVALVVVAVLVASLRAPMRYDATARIASTGAASPTNADPNSLAAGLATSRELATGPAVLAAAARRASRRERELVVRRGHGERGDRCEHPRHHRVRR